MNHIFVFVLLIQLSVVMPTHMDAFNNYNIRHVKINNTAGVLLTSTCWFEIK